MIPTLDPSVKARDVLQGRILARLFADHVSRATSQMVVKGGMAMRLAHDSLRHTKDIDLDADHDLPAASVQATVRRAVREATQGGWLAEVVVTEPKQTPTTARWKISGKIPGSQAMLHLTVEVSFRHSLEEGEVRKVPLSSHGGGAVDIPVYTDEVLALNKVAALFSPHRDAPRDVMDLWLLFKAGVAPAREAVLERLGGLSGPEAVRVLWAKLDGMDQARFETEVVAIWDHDSQAPSWDDWTQIRLLVGERIEAFLAVSRSGAGHERCGRHGP